MKKYIIWIILGLICFTSSVYALGFTFDSSALTFNTNSKDEKIKNSFDNDYNLNQSIDKKSNENEEEIKSLTKRTTYLLLGNMNSDNESSESYYKRHQEYNELAAYKYYPKDANTKSGYNEENNNYKYAAISELAIPQLFSSFNELGIIYNSYGDIRITNSNDLVISTVTLPNIKIKKQNNTDPMKYDLVDTNLVIYYYYLKIDDQYRLCYLFGETTDNVNKYFESISNNETANKNIEAAYASNLSTIYDFSKINNMSDNELNNIYNSNINNLVYLSTYYNNKITSNANGFFINDGLIITTWDFLKNALVESQYISIIGSNGKTYEMDGIVTLNPDTNIAIIKITKQNGSYIKIGESSSINIEDPAITISSKSGVGFAIQKGIIISNKDYISSAIPLSQIDEGSPLFDKDGNVIGLNTSLSIDTSVSLAVNSKVLKEVQDKFINTDFNTIKTISFDKLKEDYYYNNSNKENIKNTIPKNKWKKYSKIGNIENNINLELIKASYKDGIVSLRYKNDISKYMSSMSLTSSFKKQLLKDGYEEKLNSSNKCIYENKNYQVIIMDEFDYLIIVMVSK